jgi:hypothetical protein
MQGITIAEYEYRKTVRDTIDHVFTEATKERPKRQEWVKDPFDTIHTFSWVLFERDQMFDVVIRERAKLGKGPIEMKALVRVENCAKGHADYQRKYTFYAMELVFDVKSGSGR